MMQSRSKKITYAALLVACGIVFGYIEFLFPIPIGIPGVKLGLSNIITIICIYMFDPVISLVVLFLRIVLSGMMFGNFFGIIYSLCGAALAYVSMYIAKKSNIFSIIGISALGGVFHNIGQLIIACVVVSQLRIMFYIPILLISGIICGIIVGIVSKVIINNLSKSELLKGEM